jgi:F-type H+-transporting ATPase subunit b
MLWKVINFVVLGIGIYVLWLKVIKGILVKRGFDVKNGLVEAKAAKEDAEKRAEEYKQKLSTLEARLVELAQEIRREGEAEKERIMADAATAIDKLKGHASFTLEQEIKKARIEIRREVAGLAIKMAADLLTKEIKPEDQDRLIKGYIDDIRLN